MSFDPGLQNANVPSTRQPYPEGAAAIRMSLETMAQKIREGRLDPAVIGWARGVLKDAGIDGRGSGAVIRQQTSALLDALRAQTVYAPDAAAAEVISSAGATLCLRPNLCLNGGDCDDLSVALASATLSLGIPTAIVKQTFAAQNQEHVLIAVQDESGQWLYADPSTRMPLGSASRASEEVWVDPLGPIGPLPEVHAELVTLGAVPRGVMRFEGGCWWHEGFGQGALVHHEGSWRPSGLGSIPTREGLGATFGGHPTVNELMEFSNAVGYAMNQLDTAEALCTAGWPNNPVGWNAWQMDLQDAHASFQTAADAALAKFNSTNGWLITFTTADYEWGLLVDVMHQITDLDRRLRVDGECMAPGYEDMPQPIAVDWGLEAYKGADVVTKAADAAVDKIKNAAQPVTIALGGVVFGVVLGVGAIILIDRAISSMVPARR